MGARDHGRLIVGLGALAMALTLVALPVAPAESIHENPDRSSITAAGTDGSTDAVPRFVPGPCPVATPEDADVDCGDLVVAENRSDAITSTIRVPVAILLSQHPDSADDPIVFVPGGPGSTAMDAVSLANSRFTADRDLILLGQRGTKYASPELDCPGVERAYGRSFLRADPPAAEIDAVADAADDCAERLRAKGIDLGAYDTAAVAGDVAALREALGYDAYTI